VYSWEEEPQDDSMDDEAESLEPPRPAEVPVLWHRPDGNNGPVVLIFRRPNMNESSTPKDS
ncbi:MAG: hypothetical protein ACRERV_17320, partial [Methylococcales bacterium]